MAVITMLLTAPRLKLEQAGGQLREEEKVTQETTAAALALSSLPAPNFALTYQRPLASLQGRKEFQVLAPTDEWRCKSERQQWLRGRQLVQQKVKQAADSSHGNRPMFSADTDDCQRRTMSAAGVVMVHWANPQLSLLCHLC